MTGESVPVVLRLSADDAESLVESSTSWGQDWRAQDGRFEHTSKAYAAAPSYAWKWALWVGPAWASVVLLRSYLDAVGESCEVLHDLAEHPDGSPLGYVVLTDWASPSWTT